MTRPRGEKELKRILEELRKIHRFYPGAFESELGIAQTAALIHHFGARVLHRNEWRCACDGNSALN